MNTLSKTLIISTLVVLSFPFVVLSGPVPDTGQTKCYNNSGEITCPQPGEAFYGQDAHYAINPQSFTKLDANGNDLTDDATSWVMVRDNVTGLIWEVKADDGSIHDKDNTYTWYDSNTETNGGDAGTAGTDTDTEDFLNTLNDENFGGFADWRLPTIKELAAIINLGGANPVSVDISFFPNTQSERYWSSTTCLGYIDGAWLVSFSQGLIYSFYKSSSYYVRAVRGGQPESSDNLIINGDGTVTDTSTGLMWEQKTNDGSIHDKDNTYTWEDALSWIQNLNNNIYLGYSDWRLSNRNELQSIVDYSRTNPAADTLAFPRLMLSDYWSATTYTGISGYAWHVLFYNGSINGNNDKANSFYVRAVRGGQNRVSGHLGISEPFQGSVWDNGQIMPITWDTQGIGENVNITLSRDGGKTFETIVSNTENDGNHNWAVSGTASVNCMLKIEPVTTTTKGTTQGLFSIADTLSDGLVAYYPFNGDANDESGDGNNGTVNGAILVEDLSGNQNSAYSFDGVDDSIIVNDSDSLNFSDANMITVSAWVKLGSYDQPNCNRIIGHWPQDVNEREYYLGITHDSVITDANQFVFAVNNDGGPDSTEIYSQTYFVISKWYHVAGVYDGAFIRLYVNGIEEASLEYTQGIYNGIENLYIGNDRHPPELPTYSLNGKIDEVRIYNRALSEAEVDALYNQENPDADNDGMPDAWETANGLNPTIDDSLLDPDNDKFVNGREFQDQTDPQNGASHFVLPSVTGRVPDTGQTTSYTDTPGEDSDYLINAPTYIKMDSQGNYLPDSASSWAMVYDVVTGLIWEVKQASDGVADYANPNDPDNTYTWYDSNPETNGGNAGTAGDGTDTEDFINAMNAEQYGGGSDWRLPTVKELTSIMNYDAWDSAVSSKYFPNAVSLSHWTSTTNANNTDSAWRFSFFSGYGDSRTKSSIYQVRAVRGNYNNLSDSLIDNGDGTITDISRGIMWEQVTSGPMDWESSLSRHNGLSYAGHNDWRLPSIHELMALINHKRHHPAIDSDLFPGTSNLMYWSSTSKSYLETPETDNNTQSWVIYFDGGLLCGLDKSTTNYVRAVRGGQNQILGNLFITSPLQASKWSIGSTMPITWDTKSIGENVNITLSRDGGKTYETIVSNTENNGSYDWTVIGAVSVNCMVKVEPVTTTSKGTIQGLFSIYGIQYEPADFCSGWDQCPGPEPGNPPTCQSDVAKIGSGSLLVCRANTCWKTLSTPLTGLVEFTAWAFPATDSNTNFYIILGSSVTSPNAIVIRINETNTWFYNTPENYGTYAAGYSMDWTKVKILINTTNNSYSLWLDDTLIAADISTTISLENGIDSFGLISGRGSSGHNSYVDDIRIRTLDAGDTTQSPNTPSTPSPSDTANDISLDSDLTWTGGDPDAGDTVSYDVYFSTDNPPTTLSSNDQAGTSYDPGTLDYDLTYYWKIVAMDNNGAITSGPVWSFTTANYPVATFTSLPTNLTNQTGISITIGGEGVTAYKYNLDSGGWSTEVDAGTPITASGLAVGSHTIQVIARNSSGLWQPEVSASTFNWTIDTTLPVISAFSVSDTSSGSQSLTNAKAVTVAISGSDSGGSITRWLITESATEPTPTQMNAGSSSAPTSYAIQSVGDSSKTLYAWVMDGAQNISASAQATITLDSSTSVAIDGGDQCTRLNTVTLSGSMEVGAIVTVDAESATVETVTYPTATTWSAAVSGMSQASYTVTATATDGAGNQTTDSINLRHSIPATATLDAGSVGLLADGTGLRLVTVTIKDGANQNVCDGSSFAVTTDLGSISPTTYTTVNGQFTASLVASSELGTATITVKDGETNIGNTTVEMIAGAPTSLAFVKFDDTPLPSPFTIGTNTLSAYIQVQVQDSFGHKVNVTDNTTVLLTSSVGNAAEYTPIGGSAVTGDTDVTITDGSSGTLFKIKVSQSGDMTLSAAEWPADIGWTDASHQVNVGSQTPVATLTGAPVGTVSINTASLIVGGDALTHYMYKLNSGAWSTETAVGTPINLTGLADDSYTLYVRGKNASEEWQPEIDATTVSWTVDTTCVATLTGVPSGTISTDSATVTVNGSDVVAYKYRLDSAGWSAEIAVATPISLTGIVDGLHTLYVVGKNSIGTWQAESSPTAASWTVDTTVSVPDDPTGLFVDTAQSDRIRIGWDPNTDYAVTYNVYRSQTENGVFYSVNTQPLGILNAMNEKIVFNDRNIKEGITYYYKVRASKDGVHSQGFSNQVATSAAAGDNYELKVIEKSHIANIGSTVKYYLQLLPKDKFQGTLNVSCADLPSGVTYDFLLNGESRGSSLTGVVPIASVTIAVSVGSSTSVGTHMFKVAVQNVWEGGGSSLREEYLRLTVATKNDFGIHVAVDKTDVTKGEKIRIYGAILPPLSGRTVLLSATHSDGSSETSSLTTTAGGKFEDTNWISTLGIGTHDIQASWIDDVTTTHVSEVETINVDKGQVALTCLRKTGVIPETGVDFTVLGDTEPKIDYASIIIRAIGPNGPLPDQTVYTDENGHYELFDDFFNMNGIWKFKTYWTGNADFIGCESDYLVLPVGIDYGRAIIIGGGAADLTNTYWDVTKKLTVGIYRDFMAKGFSEDMIYLMINSQVIDVDYDDVPDQVVDDDIPSVVDFTNIISTHYNANLNDQTPLFIYMQGHGTSDARFKVLGSDEFVTASQIKDALDKLQGVGAYAGQGGVDCKVVLIIEACYSGNFIPTLKGPNRIIITSAGDEPYNTDGSGQIAFSRYLFSKLLQGNHFEKAFNWARTQMVNMGYPSPNMDDSADGLLAANTYLNGQLTWGLKPEITDVTAPQVLTSSSSADLTADVVRGDNDIERVWAQIIAPSANIGGGDTTIDYPVVELSEGAIPGTYERTLTGLVENGVYKVVVLAEDTAHEVSDPNIVYISVSGAGQPGDVNGDSSVDLADAVLALKVAGGIDTSGETINIEADVNGDGMIGIREVIYILQKVSGLR